MKDVLLDLVDPPRAHDPAHLGLLAEGDDVGNHTQLLECPHAARHAHARLDLVEDEKSIVLIGVHSQPL